MIAIVMCYILALIVDEDVCGNPSVGAGVKAALT